LELQLFSSFGRTSYWVDESQTKTCGRNVKCNSKIAYHHNNHAVVVESASWAFEIGGADSAHKVDFTGRTWAVAAAAFLPLSSG